LCIIFFLALLCFALKNGADELGTGRAELRALTALLGDDLLCRGPPHRVLYNAGGVCNAHGGGSVDRNQTTH
jgi:hypothetical protein